MKQFFYRDVPVFDVHTLSCQVFGEAWFQIMLTTPQFWRNFLKLAHLALRLKTFTFVDV